MYADTEISTLYHAPQTWERPTSGAPALA
jgi:hypothetical protein